MNQLLCPAKMIDPVNPTAAATSVLPLRSDTPEWIIEAIKKLDALDKLPPGWDSYGGKALRADVRDFAVKVLGWLETDDLPVPAVVLGSGGTVQFEWSNQGREVELEVLAPGSLSLLLVCPDGTMAEAELGNNLPETLRRLAGWLSHG
ncbi:MAG TPA: hypothetical protein VG013_06115 [Gemmataceae bacterium]|nr:hypothetical protein [Gemmataceae bacterium]